MTAMLTFDSVSKKFKQRNKTIVALRDISFTVEEGEVFGFIGPNGAGKSTTIKILLDIIRDYDGEVSIFGKPSRDARSRRGISYLPESPALYDQFTPVEQLKSALRMNGIRRKDEEKWCMNWLDKFSVTAYSQRRIRHLSKGNIQRVALAHAMVVEPRLVVLDEPLSGLDPVGRKDVIDILQEYKSNGGAIFFTSHVLHDVERMADRFGFINEGELITTRDPSGLIATDEMRFIVRYQSQSSDLSTGRELRTNEYEHELTQESLPEFIHSVNVNNGRIIDIKPALSLEKVFFQILEETKSTNK